MYHRDISWRDMEPTQATWAILGLIAQKPRSGYDLKRAIDRTIRHFWAASSGQIYPALRRLEAAGWIAGDDAPRGARARRIYRITPAGSAGLDPRRARAGGGGGGAAEAARRR